MDEQQKAKLEFDVKHPIRMYRLIYHYELPPDESQMPYTRFVVARSEEDAKQAVINIDTTGAEIVFYRVEELGVCDRLVRAHNTRTRIDVFAD